MTQTKLVWDGGEYLLQNPDNYSYVVEATANHTFTLGISTPAGCILFGVVVGDPTSSPHQFYGYCEASLVRYIGARFTDYANIALYVREFGVNGLVNWTFDTGIEESYFVGFEPNSQQDICGYTVISGDPQFEITIIDGGVTHVFSANNPYKPQVVIVSPPRYDYINGACTPNTNYSTPGIYADLTACENAVNDGSVSPILIFNPTWAASKKVSLPLTTSKLGDGYRQDVVQGINTINGEWGITSPILFGTEVEDLLVLLRSLCATSFLWSPNNGLIPYKEFTCDQWAKARLGLTTYQINTTFKMAILGSGLLVPGIVSSPTSTDPYFALVQLLLHGESFADNSIHNRTITPNGGAGVNSSQKKFGGSSFYFDGSGDSLTTPVDAGLTFGADDFTWECWAYPTAYGGYVMPFLSNGRASGGGDYGLWVGIYGTSIRFATWVNADTGAIYSFSGAVPLNQWYHIACTKVGSQARIWVNGVEGTPGSIPSTNSTHSNFIVGVIYDNSGYALDYQGYIDEIRITKGIARYTANFTPPSAAFPDSGGATDPYANNVVLYLRGDGTNGSTSIVDSSPSPKTISVFGNAQISTAQSKYGGSSLLFDGSGDYLTATSSTTLQNSDYTIEAWVYVPSTSGTEMIASTTPAVASQGISLKIQSGGFLGFESGGGAPNLISSLAVTANQFNHLALSKQGNNYIFAVNGVTQTISDTTTISGYGIMAIGSNARLDYPYFLNGYIDSLRITQGVARYAANFNPETDTYLAIPAPTSPDPYANDVVLFLKGDGTNGSTNIVDSSPSSKTISGFGNTQISTAQSKYGGSSLLFDGSGDYLTSTPLNLVNVDFTVEYWIYVLTTKFGVILSSYNYPNQVGTFITHTHSNGAITAQNGISGIVTPAITNNSWIHVAATYQQSSNQLKIYLNGVLSQSISVTINDQHSTCWIGGAPNDNNLGGWWLHAYVDSLRVTRGVVRYTANFNPETDTYLNV